MTQSSKVTAAAAVIVLIAVIAFLVMRSGVIGPPAPPPITGPERAEDARGLLAELERSGNVDHDQVFERARQFQRQGQLPDAQLLYFYSARENHGPSAFALAEMNDPNHHSSETSLLPEPDAFQAFRWYSVAREQGVDEAAPRLEALREWAVARAAEGDDHAGRLLLQWER
jgi:TPR repeat protein